MRAWALALLVLGPTSAWAAPLPDYDACVLTWQTARYNVYQQTSPTGPAILMGTVALSTAMGPSSFPCPTAQGTYYYSLGTVDLNGIETRGPLVGFTIKGGAPPLALAVGGKAKVTALSMNVRSNIAGVIGPTPLGQQKAGATATILAGPLSAPSPVDGTPQTFWQLDFATGVDGWCDARFLVATP